MNDPKRLRDDLELPFERELLRAADIDRAPAGAENAALDALGIGLGVGLVGGAASLANIANTTRTSVSAPALASSKAGALLAFKWIGALLVVGSLAALGVRAFTSHRHEVAAAAAPSLPSQPLSVAKLAQNPIAKDPSPQAATHEEAPANELEIGEDEPAPKDIALANARKVAPSDSAQSTLGAELQMIDRARKAVAAHDAAGASVVLDEYARTFPKGALREEAGVARIEALLEAKKPEAALREGDMFNARYPDSAYQKSVSALKKRAFLMEMEKSANR